MAVRPIDGNDFMRQLTLDTSKGHYGEFMDGSEVAYTSREIAKFVEDMPTLTLPNEPLTQADLNEMYLNEVWLGYPDGSGETALVVSGKIYSTSSIEGAGLDLDEYIMGETLNNPTGNYKVYRRPPEGEEDA